MSRKITPGSFKTRRGAVICVYTLLIRYHEQRYGLELKRFRSDFEYDAALGQAARYARQLQLPTITLVFLWKW
jgi:hypothetical protein